MTSLLVCVALLEVGLRIAAAFVGSRPVPVATESAERIILAAGDSNVYGWGCSEDDAYPGQLQERLDERYPEVFRVVNVGLPGLNSTEVVDRLDGWLDRYRPTMVLLTVGVNNGWMRGLGGDPEARPEALPALRILRLLRLLRVSWRRLLDGPPRTGRPELERVVSDDGRVVEQRDRSTGEVLLRHRGNPSHRKPYTTDAAVRVLRRDLSEIHRKTLRRGARLVLLTYAGFELPDRRSQLDEETTRTNAEMRRLARERGLELVDVRRRFLRLLPPGAPRSDLFLSEGESHPNARGYEEIVDQLLEDVDFRTAAGSRSAPES
ncbi:MAG: GDSL-type esterase/lipase family protein [Thermoanaerobaculia bacterium]